MDEIHETDDEILAQLRGYSGWRWWELDIDGLAEQAVAVGLLRIAYETVLAKWWAAVSPSSNSSVTLVAFGATGRVEDDEAFIRMLRAELLTLLAGR